LDDLEFIDNLAVEDGKIVGVFANSKCDKCTSLPLPQGFVYEEDKYGDYVYVPKTIKAELSKKELREYLYDNGFTCNGIHYVRLKRTSGSARVGKCLFIDEALYEAEHQWELCGLEVNKGDTLDLAAFESYISLPTSSAIDTLEIDPKSILIIPDYDSIFKEDSIVVEMDENKRIKSYEGCVDVSNSIFDGQSLIDKSIMGIYGEYGMVLLRNRFFKSCCFNTNIQQWFADNAITELSQLHPDAVTMAEKIEDIKLITTPNSVKYVKFAPILQWLRNIRPTFSVVKHEKKTHFFSGKMVQAHYQLLNTLQLSEDDIHELLKPSLDYVNLPNTDTEVLKYHVKCSVLDDRDENISNVMKSKNEIVYTMMNVSDEFTKTKYFYDFKKETCRSYLNNMKKGHILIDGNYSVLFGNPYEMLLHAIGQFDGTTSLPSGHIHTSRYPYGEKILGCRSPHISTSNVLISTNMRHDLIDKYFNLTDEIVCLNSIGENILEKLSGSDFDSDTMIVTNNKILIEAALKNYEVFKVPANHVAAKKSKRYYTNADKADLDYKTSENKIGEIVNLSQELNSLMWDYINKSKYPLSEIYDDIKDIYHDICILNALSGTEIDKAKKEFEISSDREIKEIKNRWMRKTFNDKTIKPAFLGFISQTKGYHNPKKKQYNYHKTSMDYLLREINHYRSDKMDASNLLPLSECFRPTDYNENSVNWKQLKKISDMCETTTSAINAVWNKEYYTAEEKYFLSDRYREDLVCEIRNMKINQNTLYCLITYTDNKKYARISKLLFYVLFNSQYDAVSDLMSGLKCQKTYIVPSSDGDIEIYGMKFMKVKDEMEEVI